MDSLTSEHMIRNGPPPTLDAIAEHVADYMVALAAIEETCADAKFLPDRHDRPAVAH
jgi:hypothetical protein